MLKLNNINMYYDELEVLKNINFTLNDSEIVAIMGPSGCGKSTLLNIISELETPYSGTIEKKSDKVAFVFQEDRLIPRITVWDNINIVNDNKDNASIEKLIEEVGLKGFEDYLPEQLSGGMKKRCGIARAFHYGSRLLLMDEAFQGLDYSLKKEMINMLMKIWKHEEQSVLFVTHDVEDALEVASRILVLSKRPGTIIKEYALPQYSERKENKKLLNEVKKEIISIYSRLEQIAIK